jgi:hypothetical protein
MIHELADALLFVGIWYNVATLSLITRGDCSVSWLGGTGIDGVYYASNSQWLGSLW